MARDFSKNTANYMELGGEYAAVLLTGAAAVSVHAWVRPDSVDFGSTNNQVFNAKLQTGAGIILNVNASASSAVQVGGRSVSGEAFQTQNGSTSLGTAGTWYAIGGVINYAGDHIQPYYNGTAELGGAVTFTEASLTPGTPTQADNIGGNVSPPSSTAVQFDGAIAEVALWNGDIGAAGFAALAKGISPLLVRPELLVLYVPLRGGGTTEPELMNGKTGTITGTVAAFPHPRVYQAAGPVLFSLEGSAEPEPSAGPLRIPSLASIPSIPSLGRR